MPAPSAPTVAQKKAPKPTDNTLGAKLFRVIERKGKGMTYTEIAERAGMTPSKLSQLIKGHIPDPQLSTIRRVLDAVGANLCDLERA